MNAQYMLWIAVYGFITLILYICLTVNVIRGRFKYRVAIGDGGSSDLLYIIRAQANFSEHAPLTLVFMLIGVKLGVPLLVFHAIGLCFVFGRIFHAYSFTKHERKDPKDRRYRVVGMFLTFTSYLFIMGYLFYFITLSIVELLKNG